MRNLVSRGGGRVSSDFQVGPWLVRPGVNTISKNGFTVRLEPKVMELLACKLCRLHFREGY